MNSNQNIEPHTPATTTTAPGANDWQEIENNDPNTVRAKMQQFIELRAQGLSLRKISDQIGVPKSTLCDWSVRNRNLLAHLRRAELEALEETLMGSRRDQITVLSKTLKELDNAFAHKLQDWEYDLSATELFWMAANLRQHLGRLYTQAALADPPPPPPDTQPMNT